MTDYKDVALKEIFKDDFYIGVALNLDQIEGRDTDGIALVEKHFNSIVAENILKWEEIHPQRNRYNFEPADKYVAFGEKNNMFVVGHTLVWFYQTPAWVFEDDSEEPLSREALLARMKDHIFTVMGRYKGKIHGWDVVNEVIVEDGSFRKCKWYEIIGEDYVQKAFEYAREADPAAELYYNDYDYYKEPKREGIIKLIEKLKSKGIRVDGVGIQAHWFLEHPDIAEIEELVLALGKLDVKIMITEMDVGVTPFYPCDTPARDLSSFDPESQKKLNPYAEGVSDSVLEEQADRYAELFSLFRKYRNKFDRITFWAVHYKQSWRSYLPIRGRTEYPMLFDRMCNPKPAFHAVVKVWLNKE
jgi:endo-1,4-beta-xylanase